MHVPAEVMGSGEGLARSVQGEDPAGVDGLHGHVDLARDLHRPPRHVEAGPVVGDVEARALGEGLVKPLAVPGLGLDVGEVGRGGPRQCVPVRAHALDRERVVAIACPAIAAGEGLDDDQGAIELASALGGVLQAEVEARPALRQHPVDDVLAVHADGALGAVAADPGGGDLHGLSFARRPALVALSADRRAPPRALPQGCPEPRARSRARRPGRSSGRWSRGPPGRGRSARGGALRRGRGGPPGRA